jgi:hypothetical protein
MHRALPTLGQRCCLDLRKDVAGDKHAHAHAFLLHCIPTKKEVGTYVWQTHKASRSQQTIPRNTSSKIVWAVLPFLDRLSFRARPTFSGPGRLLSGHTPRGFLSGPGGASFRAKTVCTFEPSSSRVRPGLDLQTVACQHSQHHSSTSTADRIIDSPERPISKSSEIAVHGA